MSLLPIRLYYLHEQGVSLEELSEILDVPTDAVKERIESVRLLLDHQWPMIAGTGDRKAMIAGTGNRKAMAAGAR